MSWSPKGAVVSGFADGCLQKHRNSVHVCVCSCVKPRMVSSRINPEEKRGHLKNRVSVRGEQRQRAYLGKSGGLDDGGGCVNACCLESEEDKEDFYFPPCCDGSNEIAQVEVRAPMTFPCMFGTDILLFRFFFR